MYLIVGMNLTVVVVPVTARSAHEADCGEPGLGRLNSSLNRQWRRLRLPLD